jgi:hypothetical protein
MLLFGGYETTSPGNDTWSWNGSTWTVPMFSGIPAARYGASMAYDPATGTVLLFGGYEATGPSNDTWTWSG